MQKSFFFKRAFIGSCLFVMLFLIATLAACSTATSTIPTGTPTISTSTTPKSTSSATPNSTPGIRSGVQPCPGETGNTAYWQTIIGTAGGPQQVQSVSCANITGTAALQALVTDHRSNAGDALDVYVFNNITSAASTKVFQVLGLVKGAAKISGYNTIMTAQADEL